MFKLIIAATALAFMSLTALADESTFKSRQYIGCTDDIDSNPAPIGIPLSRPNVDTRLLEFLEQCYGTSDNRFIRWHQNEGWYYFMVYMRPSGTLIDIVAAVREGCIQAIDGLRCEATNLTDVVIVGDSITVHSK